MRDRNEIRAWYGEHYRHLPPGLARRYWLPARLESQMVIRAVLPLDLARRAYPVPATLERELPPPPDCERLVIGGHIVLMNRRTKIVLDIFHFN